MSHRAIRLSNIATAPQCYPQPHSPESHHSMRKHLLAVGAIAVLCTAAVSGEDGHRSDGAPSFSPLNQINEQTVSRLGR